MRTRSSRPRLAAMRVAAEIQDVTPGSGQHAPDRWMLHCNIVDSPTGAQKGAGSARDRRGGMTFTSRPRCFSAAKLTQRSAALATASPARAGILAAQADWVTMMFCAGIGAGKPASAKDSLMLRLVSKYTCQ